MIVSKIICTIEIRSVNNQLYIKSAKQEN